MIKHKKSMTGEAIGRIVIALIAFWAVTNIACTASSPIRTFLMGDDEEDIFARLGDPDQYGVYAYAAYSSPTVWYRYINGGWEWTPYAPFSSGIECWMQVTDVGANIKTDSDCGGDLDGEPPSQENIEIIIFLAVNNPEGAEFTEKASSSTTTPPSTAEIQTLDSISASSLGTFEFSNSDLAVYEIAVRVSNSVTLPSITIIQSSSEPATVTIAAPDSVYTYIAVEKDNIADADIVAVAISFKVTKSWVNVNNIDASTITLQQYASGVWADISAFKVGEDDTYIYLESYTNELQVFTITAEKAQ